MTIEEIETQLNQIKNGEILKLKLYRNGEQFLDGKYDEIKLEISYHNNSFQIYETKSEIFWDGAAGAGSTFTDEEVTKMTEDQFRQYLAGIIANKNHSLEIN